jgi:hypothetical protein
MDGAALIIVISGGVFGAVARSVPPGEQDAPTRTVRNAPMRIEGRASARNEWEIPAESQREPTRDRRTIRPIVVCGLSCRGGKASRWSAGSTLFMRATRRLVAPAAHDQQAAAHSSWLHQGIGNTVVALGRRCALAASSAFAGSLNAFANC